MNWFLVALIGVLAVSAFIVSSVQRRKAKKVMKLKAKRKRTKIPYYSQDYQIRYASVKNNYQKHPHYIYLVKNGKKGKTYYSISLTTHPKKEMLEKDEVILLKRNSDPQNSQPEYAVKEKYFGSEKCYDHTDFHSKKSNYWELDDEDIVKLNAFANKRTKKRMIKLKKD